MISVRHFDFNNENIFKIENNLIFMNQFHFTNLKSFFKNLKISNTNNNNA